MRLSYRGVQYDRHASTQSERPLCPVREFDTSNCRRYCGVVYYAAPHPKPTQVPAKLAIFQLTYRGIAYYKLIYQNITFFYYRNR